MTCKKVLVIERELAETALLTGVLDTAGYDVIRAANGRDGVRASVIHQPDLVIIDRALGDMDGWEVYEHLLSHELTASIPVIFLSARDALDRRVQDWIWSSSHFLGQPFDADDLLQTVRTAVEDAVQTVAA